MSEDILDFVREVSGKLEFSRHDLLVDLDGLVSEERWIAGGHLVHENSQGPPVHRLVVALKLVEYWNISNISIQINPIKAAYWRHHRICFPYGVLCLVIVFR